MSFYGKSFVSGPLGDILAQGGEGEEILIATCDRKQIREARNLFQFFRDRRVDTYGPLLEKIKT
jgi:N-carbamoylputrescine amidase